MSSPILPMSFVSTKNTIERPKEPVFPDRIDELERENADLKKLVEQLRDTLKEVRKYSCSHMQRTTHDRIDAVLLAAKGGK